ncbi:unnamed protein product [Sphagnum jensenii]|uniref:NB-ARC domain-containing protein n=1 Tax=Sphagnum jensenii TaxID=128206 RepID=A0ABP0XGA5_9BRYO
MEQESKGWENCDPSPFGEPSSIETHVSTPPPLGLALVDPIQEIVQVHNVYPNDGILKHPDLVIIFFHGIVPGNKVGLAWKETWTSSPTNGKENIFWPERWLPNDIGNNVQILSLSYNTNIFEVHDDVTEIGKNLLHSLVVNSRYATLWIAPIALVGYSFGGLVLKSLVVDVHKRIYQKVANEYDIRIKTNCKRFLENLKGTIFYGVPHTGGPRELLDYFIGQSQEMNSIDKKLIKAQPSLLNNIESFNRQMEQLTVDFGHAIEANVNIYAFVEGKPFNQNGEVLVPYASAQRLSGNNNYKVEDATHLTICQPCTKDHISYSKMVECLKACLKKSTRLPILPQWEVGLERKANDINNLLQKVPIVSLVGMGGIGKTTMSKKVYHLFHDKYDKFSFLEDVKSKRIEDVQKQLLEDLCGRKMTEEEDINDNDLDCIRNCMIFKKVLVVVDDVGTRENLIALQVLAIGRKQNGIVSSNVIVTCRNWQILEGHVSENGKMDVAPLNMEEAKELFLFQAFRITKVVKKGFEVIFDEIVQACDGLPLSLEVMGGFLHTKQQSEIWKDVLQRLCNAEALDGGKDDKLWRSLQISYEDLQPTERNMFLDIACYFCGFNEQMIIQIWDSQSSPQLGLQNLKDRSLVKLNENGNLVMHDQLRDMGRKFATIEEKNRLWDSKKESFQCLQHKEVAQKMEGIFLNGNENLPLSLFKNLEFPSLRLLHMIEMKPKFVEVFIQRQNVQCLQWLCLDISRIKKLPNDLVHCFHLHVLDLSQCHNLKKLPKSIGKLTALQTLDLSWCLKLKELPTSIGRLTTLQLDLSRCSELKELPTSIGQLTALQKLNLDECSKLKELPTSIGQLTTLQTLKLSMCSKLKGVPTSIDQLTALQELDLSRCSELKELPTSIGQLTALQKLNLDECSKLKELPTSIGQLTTLQELDLSWCFELKELPTSIGQLKVLRKLDLDKCSKLKELPTSIGQLTALQELNLSGCSKLKELPTSIGQLTTLQELNLSGCFEPIEGFTKVGFGKLF